MATKHQRVVKDLTTGSIGNHLVKLALPLLGTSFIQLLYSFVDMAWLGRLSAESVAAVGAASVFVWLANSFSLLNKVGAEVSVANAIGRGDEAEARAYASHTSTIGFIMGLIMMLIYGLFTNGLIGFYRLEPSVHDQGVSYLQIVALGMPFIYMLSAHTGIYNATGHSKIPFIITTIAVGMNIILDPIFIFILKMGTAGAALATVISQATGLTLMLYQLKIRDKLLGGMRILTNLQKHLTINILRLGVPVAVMNSLFAFINMILGRSASMYGGHIGVMTLTTGGQLEGLSWNTAQGFSTALSAFTAQNYGAQKRDRIQRAVRWTLYLSLFVGVAACLFYYFWGEGLFSLIVPEVAAYTAGAVYLRIQAIPQIFSMIEITCQGFFYGIRRTLPPSIISIGGNLLRIPLAIVLLPLTGDITTLWWIIAGTSILKGFVAGIWFFVERNRLRRMI